MLVYPLPDPTIGFDEALKAFLARTRQFYSWNIPFVVLLEHHERTGTLHLPPVARAIRHAATTGRQPRPAVATLTAKIVLQAHGKRNAAPGEVSTGSEHSA